MHQRQLSSFADRSSLRALWVTAWRHPRLHSARTRLITQALILGVLVATLWLIELVDLVLGGPSLDYYGIHPRTGVGLRNVLLSPWLHAGFGHLLANTIPLVVLGLLVMLRRTTDFFVVVGLALLVSGLGIWLFAASGTIHLGASGVVFGLLGYLLWRGYLDRSVVSISLGLVALFLYGGMLLGVLPLNDGVSWLGHLFGFVGGVLAAYVLTRWPLSLAPRAQR